MAAGGCSLSESFQDVIRISELEHRRITTPMRATMSADRALFDSVIHEVHRW